MVCGAVPATCIAVSLDEIITAIHALPVDKVRRHQHLLAELFVDVLEILEEIEDKIVIA